MRLPSAEKTGSVYTAIRGMKPVESAEPVALQGQAGIDSQNCKHPQKRFQKCRGSVALLHIIQTVIIL
jgi:hypothetical protein